MIIERDKIIKERNEKKDNTAYSELLANQDRKIYFYLKDLYLHDPNGTNEDIIQASQWILKSLDLCSSIVNSTIQELIHSKYQSIQKATTIPYHEASSNLLNQSLHLLEQQACNVSSNYST